MLGLEKKWTNLDAIIAYGFGRVGRANIEKVLGIVNVKAIIDQTYCGESYEKIPILRLEQCQDVLLESKIVIFASGKAYLSIANELKKLGLTEKEDYINFEVFLLNYFWSNQKRLCMSKVVLPLTNKCSLNCAKCNSFIPYANDKVDIDIEQLKSDVQAFFEVVDELSVLALVGGEPLLYRDIDVLIEFIANRFGSRIGTILLITNGTIIPSDIIFAVLAKYHIDVRISNYGLNEKYLEKVQNLKLKLQDMEIPFLELSDMEWLDIGYPTEVLEMGKTDDELYAHMMQCESYCHGLYNGKYYFCSEAIMAEMAGLFKVPETDCIDLNRSDIPIEDTKVRLLEYQLGQMPNKYFSFCKYCRGLGASNTCTIKAGIQME